MAFPNPLSARFPRRRRASRPSGPLRNSRGWSGRGGGRTTVISPAPEFRGTSVQVCGLWPFVVGSGAPMKGVPLGRHQDSLATVCCDPIGWFQQAKLISNPSAFVLGLPGLGKSTVLRRWIVGLCATGVLPFVLGDVKPDHVQIITAMGGQHISLRPGIDHINVLDPGESRPALALLEQAAAPHRRAHADAAAALHALRPDLNGDLRVHQDDPTWAPEVRELVTALRTAAAEIDRLQGFMDELVGRVRSRQRNMLESLITISRGQIPSEREGSMLLAALQLFEARNPGQIPVIADILEIVKEGPDEVRRLALDRGEWDRYLTATDELQTSLMSLVEGGRLGSLFSEHTTHQVERNRPAVYDISAIDENDTPLLAAALLACWSDGFAAIETSQILADAGLEPQRHYFVVMDELWKTLSAGPGIVDRVNSLTRLNRQWGVGTAMASHSMADLGALPEEDRAKALGFVERAGLVVLGGLPSREMPALNTVVHLSEAEQARLTAWTSPATWDPVTGRESAPPGRGKFLIKVGERPGVPIDTKLTASELDVNDTNGKWAIRSRITNQEAPR